MEAWDQKLGDVQEGEIKLDKPPRWTVRRLDPRHRVRRRDSVQPRESAEECRSGTTLRRCGKNGKQRSRKRRKQIVLRTPHDKQNVTRGTKEKNQILHVPHTTYHIPRPLHLGTLVHKFLESWDFTLRKNVRWPAKLRRDRQSLFSPARGLLKEPFSRP